MVAGAIRTSSPDLPFDRQQSYRTVKRPYNATATFGISHSLNLLQGMGYFITVSGDEFCVQLSQVLVPAQLVCRLHPCVSSKRVASHSFGQQETEVVGKGPCASPAYRGSFVWLRDRDAVPLLSKPCRTSIALTGRFSREEEALLASLRAISAQYPYNGIDALRSLCGPTIRVDWRRFCKPAEHRNTLTCLLRTSRIRFHIAQTRVGDISAISSNCSAGSIFVRSRPETPWPERQGTAADSFCHKEGALS